MDLSVKRSVPIRIAAVMSGALLVANSLSPIASAAPARSEESVAPALATHELFQNSCTADRQSSEEAADRLANGGPPDDNIETTGAQPWRSAFTNVTRGGPIQPRYCWFSQQFPDDIGPGPSR